MSVKQSVQIEQSDNFGGLRSRSIYFMFSEDEYRDLSQIYITTRNMQEEKGKDEIRDRGEKKTEEMSENIESTESRKKWKEVTKCQRADKKFI